MAFETASSVTPHKEWTEGFYREIQDLAGFDRHCVVLPASSLVFRVVREEGKFAEEREKVTLKSRFAEALVQSF